MRKLVGIACLSALSLIAIPAGIAQSPSSGQGSIEIVFKDGHRQSFNLSDVARIEFPANTPTAAASASASRRRFLGKWEVGDGNGGKFFISLYEDGEAKRTIGNVRGKWEYVDGEAHIAWDDGAQDAIRQIGNHFQKYAYRAGKSFTDTPDNVDKARNTMPNPL